MAQSNSSDNESAEDQQTPLNNIQQAPAPWSVDKAIYHIGCGKYQYWLFSITGIIWAADAMEMMLLAFLLPILQRRWDLTGVQSSCIGVALFIGMLLGATTLAVLSDKYGRKKVIIIGNLCTAVFGVLSGIAPNLAWMIIFRFGVGFFMTTGCVAYTLFAEFIPPEKDPARKRGSQQRIQVGNLLPFTNRENSTNTSNNSINSNRPIGIMTRGKLLIVQGVFWSFGALFSVFLAWLTLTYLNWRWYLILSSVPLWFAFFGTLSLPESPHYLIVADKSLEATDLLNEVAIYNGYPLPNGWKLKPNPKKDRGRITDLFGAPYTDTTILLYAIYSCCVFSYYGISFISVRYFEKLDKIYNAEIGLYWEMAITTCAELPAIIFGLLLIDTVGRRGVMNIAFFCFACSCYLLIVHQLQMIRILGIAMIFLGRMWINLGFIGLGIYFVEYYPTYIRTTALGFAISLGRFAGIITTFTAEAMHITLGLYLYGCAGLIAFVASILIARDTANSELKEQ